MSIPSVLEVSFPGTKYSEVHQSRGYSSLTGSEMHLHANQEALSLNDLLHVFPGQANSSILNPAFFISSSWGVFIINHNDVERVGLSGLESLIDKGE